MTMPEWMLKEIEENFCCCIDAFTKRGMIDPNCQVNDIIEHIRYRMQNLDAKVEKFYSDDARGGENDKRRDG